jgi:hypothetical protein
MYAFGLSKSRNNWNTYPVSCPAPAVTRSHVRHKTAINAAGMCGHQAALSLTHDNSEQLVLKNIFF